MIQKVKKRIFDVLHGTSTEDVYVRVFHVFIITLIFLNVFAVILETVESLSLQYMILFRAFEVFSVFVFTVEYILRLWTCTTDKRFRGTMKGRFRFSVTPLALVDLMAILPFYLPMCLPLDLRFIRALRLFRLLRILKMGRYSESLRTLGNVLKEGKAELLITVFGVLILLVVASSLMYFVENAAQPKAFSSIPAAMWWGVATLTTVGYGDIYPITPLGRFLGAIIAILGIGAIAIPAGILTSGFAKEIQKRHEKRGMCPYCGKDMTYPQEKSANSG
ncbi:Cyclic nucleotide-gated potassium channel [Candidatus Brocadiaceae bacterium]|nr:Cyclic nucleotide-gated potassium channel [Candidatus Brocadiaceae bacterium]